MAFTTEIEVDDQATPMLLALQYGVSEAQLKPKIGAAVKLLVQKNFLKLPENKMGFPSTGFWADAARSTNYQAVAEGALVSVNKQGVRQRLLGGEITPVKGKYLTIPAIAEAYGKRAGEFSNLRIQFGRGRQPVALVERSQEPGGPSRTGTSQKGRNKGSRKVSAPPQPGRVYYWLVKSVSQRGNPDVMPTGEEIEATAIEAVAAAANRAVARTQKNED